MTFESNEHIHTKTEHTCVFAGSICHEIVFYLRMLMYQISFSVFETVIGSWNQHEHLR